MPQFAGGRVFVDSRSSGDMIAYIESVQPLHERLQQILTQVAGYSLLVLTHGRRLQFLDTPVIVAREALAAAHAQLAGVEVPVTAGPHHDHTLAASEAIKQALDCLMTCLRPGTKDHAQAALTRALRGATDHLRIGTRLLPGFEMVELSQACCAAHSARPTLICQTVGG